MTPRRRLSENERVGCGLFLFAAPVIIAAIALIVALAGMQP